MRYLVLTAFLLAPPNLALAAATESAVFEITANGFYYGEMRLKYTDANQKYDFEVAAEAQGILGLLIRSKYSGSSSGRLGSLGNLVSNHFQARSKRVFKDRKSDVTFDNYKPIAVTVTPKKDHTPLTDPTTVTDKRTDPLSFLASLFHNTNIGCPLAGDLYDGRRLTRVSVAPVPAESGHIRCKGTYAIIMGPDHSIQSGKRSFNVELEYQKTTTALVLQKAWFTSGHNILELVRLAK